MSLPFINRVSFKHYSGLTKCLFNLGLKRSFTSKSNEGKSHMMKSALTGIAIGTFAGAGYTIYQQFNPDVTHIKEIQNNNKVASFPKVEISRKVGILWINLEETRNWISYIFMIFFSDNYPKRFHWLKYHPFSISYLSLLLQSSRIS